MLVSKDEENIFLADNSLGNYSILWYSKNTQNVFLKTKRIDIDSKNNTIPISVSFDNSFLTIEKLELSKNQKSLFVYNLSDNNSKLISTNHTNNHYGGIFSPTENILAYISDGTLVIYNCISKKSFYPTNIRILNFIRLQWSINGNFIFLLDKTRTVWKYSIKKHEFSRIVTIPGTNNINSINLTPICENESNFLFISNNQTKGGFNQIFLFRDQTFIEQLTFDSTDKSLTERPTFLKNLIYRYNIDGYWKIRANGISNEFSKLKNGVIYDFYKSVKSQDVFILQTAYDQPCVLAKFNENGLSNIHNPNPIYPSQAFPKKVFNKWGIYHLVYEPSSKPKNWILWIHGGPHEQVSIRYNYFFSNFLKNGFGLIIMNYPGSTGFGKSYEMDDLPDGELINVQLKNIQDDLYVVKSKFHIESKINLIGISYGSILAHKLAATVPNLFNKLIDFSGIYKGDVISPLKQFFIYGNYDYMLLDDLRLNFLNKNSKSNNSLILYNEGHYILNKWNTQKALESLLKFLN